MDLAHLHLLLNHFPTVGTAIAIGILLLSIVRNDASLRRIGLEVMYVIALVTLPAYITGIAAQGIVVMRDPDALPRIEAHHNMAMLSSFLMLLVGGAAWVSLWRARRASTSAAATPWVTIGLAVLTFLLMARAGTMGGEVRHPEIIAEGSAGTTAISLGGLTVPAIALFVNERTWIWPSLETLHFIGLFILFGVILVVNLRLLGLLRSVSFAAVHRLLPWGVLALAVNIVSGMLFAVAMPDAYATNISFHWKMGCFILAGFNLLYLTSFDQPWDVKAGADTSTWVKTMAVSSLVLWIGVMYFGRMLPFIGNAF